MSSSKSICAPLSSIVYSLLPKFRGPAASCRGASKEYPVPSLSTRASATPKSIIDNYDNAKKYDYDYAGKQM
jgi:hypothetical protein